MHPGRRFASQGVSLQVLTSSDQVAELRRSTAAHIVDAIKARQITELDVQLAAPIIILPENNALPLGPRLVINLGNVCVCSRKFAIAMLFDAVCIAH